MGTLRFRGFEPKRVPIASAALSDEDFKPRFEQKGVDMRLGFDIAAYAADRSVDRVILVTGDAEGVPVMKRAGSGGEGTTEKPIRFHSRSGQSVHVNPQTALPTQSLLRQIRMTPPSLGEW